MPASVQKPTSPVERKREREREDITVYDVSDVFFYNMCIYICINTCLSMLRIILWVIFRIVYSIIWISCCLCATLHKLHIHIYTS